MREDGEGMRVLIHGPFQAGGQLDAVGISEGDFLRSHIGLRLVCKENGRATLMVGRIEGKDGKCPRWYRGEWGDLETW